MIVLVNLVLQDIAALHALGMADLSESDLFVANADPALLAERDAFGEIVGEMSCLSAKAPAPTVKDRLMARIGAAGSEGKRASLLPDGVVALVRSTDGKWMQTPFAGIQMKKLFYDENSGNLSVLVRMDPGSIYPNHHHKGLEHSLVLEGDAVFSDHTLHAGDYEVGEADHDHSSITTKGGCLVFIMHNRSDIVYAQ